MLLSLMKATGQRSADNKEVDKNSQVFTEEIRTADFVWVTTLLHEEDNHGEQSSLCERMPSQPDEEKLVFKSGAFS